MPSQDVKAFLARETGLPDSRWKRRTKSKGDQGADLRTFEDTGTGRTVDTSEVNGRIRMLHDSAGDDPNVDAFALLLLEEPSFDDHLDNFEEDDREALDLSYRWNTGLVLGGRAKQEALATLVPRLQAVLPGFRITPPGQTTLGGYTSDGIIFLESARPSLFMGHGTNDHDRQTVQTALLRAGWCFVPSMADADHGEDQTFTELVTIATWRPGMVATPLTQSPGWPAQVDAFQRQIDGIPEATEQQLQDILNAAMGFGIPSRRHQRTDRSPNLPSVPSPKGNTTGSRFPSEHPWNEGARFSFAFGENPDLPLHDGQREWLEIDDAQNPEADDHISDVLFGEGLELPVCLEEVMERTFVYPREALMGDADETEAVKPLSREDLCRMLLALGLAWDRSRCVLAQQGFDPNVGATDHPPEQPWWRAGLNDS